MNSAQLAVINDYFSKITKPKYMVEELQEVLDNYVRFFCLANEHGEDYRCSLLSNDYFTIKNLIELLQKVMEVEEGGDHVGS